MSRKGRIAIGAVRAVALTKVGLKLVDVLASAGETILEAIGDRKVTANEAETLASRALRNENIKLRVKGRDVIDDQTQDHLVRAFARICANVVNATREPEPEPEPEPAEPKADDWVA